MAYHESLSALKERAEWIESMEGTLKYKYREVPDDATNYTGAAIKRFVLLTVMIFVGFTMLLVVGIILPSTVLAAFSGTMLLFELFFIIIFIKGLKSNKTIADKHLDDVEFAFNAYGVVFRVCSDIRNAVFAYEWKDFESITEYEKVLVGIKQNVAYIFPKRIFSEEEYNIFRRFSYAALGKKCVYKNFKQY